jgi:hypothetical protein
MLLKFSVRKITNMLLKFSVFDIKDASRRENTMFINRCCRALEGGKSHDRLFVGTCDRIYPRTEGQI